MNKRDKKKFKENYLIKIDNAIKQEVSKKKVSPDLQHIILLTKLYNFIKIMDYEIYYNNRRRGIFPKKLSLIMNHGIQLNFLSKETDALFSDALIQRECAFKLLNI